MLTKILFNLKGFFSAQISSQELQDLIVCTLRACNQLAAATYLDHFVCERVFTAASRKGHVR